MLIDSHAHLDSERYEEDRVAMLERAHAAGVEMILAVGIGEGPETMHAARDLCRQHAGDARLPRLVASAGVHPQEAARADAAALERLNTLAAAPEVVAIGEIGLDYYHADNPAPEVQQHAFAQQMEIAAAHRLPILIHCRPAEGDDRAWNDTLAMLETTWRPTGLGGVLHCFTGTWEQARRAMEIGFLISFAGNVTFPKAQALRDVVAQAPLDRLLVETDAPFLAPMPNRGKRNEPAWVRRVAETLAQVRGVDLEQIAAATTENFRRLVLYTGAAGS
jgi:TatD DNase family protein